MRPRRWSILFGVLLVSVATVVAIVLLQRNIRGDGSQETPAISISIAGPNLIYSALLFVAAKRGYFRQNGLDVTIVATPSGKAALERLADGQYDMVVAAEGPFAFAVAKGRPFVVVASIGASEADHGIVAWRQRGIAKPGDLLGKRVGLAVETSAHFFFDRWLVASDIPRDSVSLVRVLPTEGPMRLASGEFDALATWEPHLNQAETLLGPAGIRLGAAGLYTIFWNVVVRADDLRQHRPVVDKVLRALLAAQEFVRTHPEEAKGIVGEAIAVDPAVMERLWPLYRFDIGLSQALVVSMEEQIRWAAGLGLVPASARGENYLQRVDTVSLERVQPRSVTIVR